MFGDWKWPLRPTSFFALYADKDPVYWTSIGPNDTKPALACRNIRCLQVLPMTYTKYSPKNQVPHQPDRKDMFDTERSQKVLQYNSQPLESNLPVQFFSYKTDLMENPFMLTPGGRVNTEYYRGIPIPIVETKEISTFDVIKTKFYNVQIGHPALGGLIDVTGHVQLAIGAPTTPMVPVGGKNRVVVTLKPFNAGLKSVSSLVFALVFV